MGKRQLNILISPVFTVFLCLLVANDFIFKSLFHNWFTGKLSDLSGLFIFPIFWAAFFPLWRKSIYLTTGLGFIFWKSIYSQPLIDWVNTLQVFTVGRIIDLTDLLALAVLPFSYFYVQKYGPYLSKSFNLDSCLLIRRILRCVVCAFSLFAFTATQSIDDQSSSYYKDYKVDIPKAELIDKLNNIGLKYVSHHRLPDYMANLPDRTLSEEERNLYQLTLVTGFCKSSLFATVTLHEDGNKTTLKLKYIRYRCDTHEPEHDKQILRIFEREVIDKLRTNTASIYRKEYAIDINAIQQLIQPDRS